MVSGEGEEKRKYRMLRVGVVVSVDVPGSLLPSPHLPRPLLRGSPLHALGLQETASTEGRGTQREVQGQRREQQGAPPSALILADHSEYPASDRKGESLSRHEESRGGESAVAFPEASEAAVGHLGGRPRQQ